MPHTLRNLIRAFGGAGVAGQSFRNNVPGAGSGVAMSDYVLYGWPTWVTTDAAGNHTSGSVVHFEVDFSCGNKWKQYLRGASPAAVMSAHPASDTDPQWSANVQGGVWEGGSAGRSTVAIKLIGRPQYGTYSGGSGVVTITRNYYKFYDSPDAPTGTQDEDWEIIASVNSGIYSPPSLTAASDHLIIEYPGDTFNAPLSFDYGAIGVYGYDAGPNPINMPMTEWHTNSSYTSLFDTSPHITFSVGVSNQRGTLYLRYRNTSSDPWTNYGPVSYHDVRFP